MRDEDFRPRYHPVSAAFIVIGFVLWLPFGAALTLIRDWWNRNRCLECGHRTDHYNHCEVPEREFEREILEVLDEWEEYRATWEHRRATLRKEKDMTGERYVPLKNLNPVWLDDLVGEIPDIKKEMKAPRKGIALAHDCPCGKCTERVILPLAEPLDGGHPVSNYPQWRRQPGADGKPGVDFESLTIRPSVWRDKNDGACGAHWWLNNGQCEMLNYGSGMAEPKIKPIEQMRVGYAPEPIVENEAAPEVPAAPEQKGEDGSKEVTIEGSAQAG